MPETRTAPGTDTPDAGRAPRTDVSGTDAPGTREVPAGEGVTTTSSLPALDAPTGDGGGPGLGDLRLRGLDAPTGDGGDREPTDLHASLFEEPLAPGWLQRLHPSWRTTPVPTSLLPTGPDGAPSLTALVAGHDDVSAFVRNGRGIVGVDRRIVIRDNRPQRIEALRRAWRAVVGASTWEDPLRRPGTGPVAIGAVTFSSRTGCYSLLGLHRAVIGLDDAGAWVTTLADNDLGHPDPVALLESVRSYVARPSDLAVPRSVTVLPPRRHGKRTREDPLTGEEWMGAVAAAQERMRSGEARKVVMARCVGVEVDPVPHVGEVLDALARLNPTAWTYGVQSMVGASPEMLLHLADRQVFSRVLAGTARRHVDPVTDPRGAAAEAAELAAWLRSSTKNVQEHELARASAIEALEPLCEDVVASEPYVLELPNVLHLATDVTARAVGDTGALALVQALHPTAAVCGTPREAAARIITDLEGLERGFYAGPVGWVDWHGEGEWCVALRGARLPAAPTVGRRGPGPVTVYGGGGIMPESDPADELAETDAKMRTVMDALGSLSTPCPHP